MEISVDRYKNESPKGKKRATAKESLYFGVKGSTGTPYEVTLNYGSGHFCSCRGMIAKIRKHGAVGTLDPRQSLNIAGPPMHWCKHIKEVRSPSAFELRIEARRIRNECFGIHEAPQDPETGRTIDEVAAPASNRRKAVAATKASHGDKSPAERLAEIEAQRETLLLEIAEAEAAEKAVGTAISALVTEHGIEKVKAALAKAS